MDQLFSVLDHAQIEKLDTNPTKIPGHFMKTLVEHILMETTNKDFLITFDLVIGKI